MCNYAYPLCNYFECLWSNYEWYPHSIGIHMQFWIWYPYAILDVHTFQEFRLSLNELQISITELQTSTIKLQTSIIELQTSIIESIIELRVMDMHIESWISMIKEIQLLISIFQIRYIHNSEISIGPSEDNLWTQCVKKHGIKHIQHKREKVFP